MMNTAVLYRSDRPNTTLQPTQTAQLLQGFLNIQNKLDVNDGQLALPELERYTTIPFADVNSDVADYFVKNFNQIAPLDGNADTISINDLVVRRSELPRNMRPIIMPPDDLSGEGAPCPSRRLNPNDLFRRPI